MDRYWIATVAVMGALVMGCAESGGSRPAGSTGMAATPAAAGMAAPKDGELKYPAGYQSWDKFLTDVQRPDAKQVRDIYINAVGARVAEGQPFPQGTIMVMELHKAKMDGETLVTGADGKLVKGDIAKIFVMEKGNERWGQDVPEPLKNGAWVFSAYGPDGKALAEDFSKCRACHAPMAQKDFTHRLDEYLQQRRTRG